METINQVTILGNLGADPEAHGSITRFSVATVSRHRDKRGDWVEDTTWHRIVCFSGLAENVKKYMKKGSKVLVQGSLRNSQWTDKQGVVRYSTDVVAERVVFL